MISKFHHEVPKEVQPLEKRCTYGAATNELYKKAYDRHTFHELSRTG